MKARLWLAQGQAEKAEGWAHDYQRDADGPVVYAEEIQHLVLMRVLIARKEAGRALQHLTRLEQAARSGQRASNLIEILLLHALAHHALRHPDAAQSALGEALRLAEPQSHRLFSGNWEGTAAVDAILPRERYLLGYPDGGGTIRDGVYWTNLGPEIHLGLLEGQSTEGLERVRAVFARARFVHTPQGHHGIPDVFVNASPVRQDRGVHGLPQTVHRVTRFFGIHRLAHRGEVGPVGKENGDLFALGLRFGRRRQSGKLFLERRDCRVHRGVSQQRALRFQIGNGLSELRVCAHTDRVETLVSIIMQFSESCFSVSSQFERPVQRP